MVIKPSQNHRMQNINKFIQEQLKDLKLGTKLNEMLPQTVSGHVFKNECVDYLHTKPITVSFVSEVVAKGSGVNDESVSSFVKSISDKILESKLAFNLALVSENIAGVDDKMSELLTEKIDEVILEGEESIKNDLINGGFAGFQTSRIIASMIKESLPVAKDKTDGMYKISMPLSYTESHDNATYMHIKNMILKIEESGIYECDTPSQTFSMCSNVVRYSDIDRVTEKYTIKSVLGDIVISENGIDIVGTEHNTNMNKDRFISFVKESMDNADYTRDYNKRNNISAVGDAVVSFLENKENVVDVNIFKIVENTHNGDSFIIGEHNKALYVGVLESKYSKQVFQRYDNLSEGLKAFKNISGYDMSEFYNESLKADDKMRAENVECIRKIDEEINTDNMLITKINEELTVSGIGSDSRTHYLELLDKTKNHLATLTSEKSKLQKSL